MSSAVRTQQRWDASDYLRIVEARFEAGDLVVRFGDGTEDRIEVQRLTRVQAQRPDWSALSFHDDEVIVPTEKGDIEVSSFAIRSLADETFRAHVGAKEREAATLVGHRIRELRRNRGLTVAALAARAVVSPSLVWRIEQGRHDGDLTELRRIVDAMDYELADLSDPETEQDDSANARTA